MGSMKSNRDKDISLKSKGQDHSMKSLFSNRSIGQFLLESPVKREREGGFPLLSNRNSRTSNDSHMVFDSHSGLNSLAGSFIGIERTCTIGSKVGQPT